MEVDGGDSVEERAAGDKKGLDYHWAIHSAKLLADAAQRDF